MVNTRVQTAADGRLVGAVAESPFGPVLVAAGVQGVVAVEVLGSPEGFEAGLLRRGFGVPVALEDAPSGQARDLAAATRDAIEAALDGADAGLDQLPIDLSDRPAWDRLVLEGVRSIPRGTTASYGEVARRIGRAGAARAVGGAVGRNPVGLLVPCHRVIAGDGGLGGYGAAAWGGIEAALDLKADLLRLEGVGVVGRRVSRR